ncbi:acetylglutamate kinase [Calidifontibacillus erzurumensis]|uniref:Acetylglutamate kinase n=1 Tax=Calidifontibacillus erzurumensis TaxID=2741433 RepID=A0A8J8GFR0_9BACI|nr:acetylglutamate kinase [Calidifontibacillus erzurumensis]NSL51485.1 acetylglutamate kinase [Calidifontibacillus erzurumensis]
MNDIVLIKCGGSTLEQLSDKFFESIADLIKLGKKPVIVHGGGPAIGEMLASLNIESVFVDGLRKTTAEVMEVVEMVLAGKVNTSIVGRLQKTGVKTIGLAGVDGQLLKAKPINFEQLGYVGEIEQVNAQFLLELISIGFVPVIAPIGVDDADQRYNINADTAAGAIAKAIGAEQLLFVTDVPGILKDGKLIEKTTPEEIEEMIEDGTIYGGMLPKVKAAIDSLTGNIKEVIIVNGKDARIVHDGQIIGTKIVKENILSI